MRCHLKATQDSVHSCELGHNHFNFRGGLGLNMGSVIKVSFRGELILLLYSYGIYLKAKK